MPLVLIIGIAMITVGIALGVFIALQTKKYRRQQQAEAAQINDERR